jgi:hypothetical protein
MTSKVNRERVIEDAIMRRPDQLGYPGALCIRNWRVALTCGRVDVGLLPIKGPKKLVLVEAKSARAPDAQSKVVGQLLMYYAGALTLGSKGLACLRTFAGNEELAPRNHSKKSLIKLGGLCPTDIAQAKLEGRRPTDLAWEKMSSGKPLLPHQLSLFIALDDEPHKFLREILDALQRHHGLSIGLVIVRNGRIVDAI